MKVSQRQVVLALLITLTSGAVLALLYQLLIQISFLSSLGTLLGTLLLGGTLVAYWRGWAQARYLLVILITLLIGLTADGEFLSEKFSLAAFLPPVLALIVAGPLWIIGSSLGLLVVLIVRAGGQGVYTEPLGVLLYLMVVSGMVLARLVTDTAQLTADESTEQARLALAQSERQTKELAQKAEELEVQIGQQRQLLDLVSTLETPAVSLADGVLLTPIVGHLDSRRIGALTQRLLSEVSSQRARMVILDIAGVPGVDTSVAQALLRTIQAVRLLGCEVTITGISASVASTMTQMGINLAGVRTARTPQEVMSADLMVTPRPARN